MSNLKNKNVEVIVQNPGLPEFLDFAFLRRKGLEHIATFSGKIWTDHNTHDPGITMLEALCYALLDLGYRTQLPLEDLFAPKELPKPGEQDDNFLTPAEILTCNPVTITDYRKLLMEVEGVRNAWLEPVETSEPTLYFDEDNCRLNCIKGTFPLHLNGLYNVYLEISNPEQLIIDPNGNCSTDIQTNEFVKKLINEVQDCLSRHRNLGEDFVKIILLCPRSVELCADIELTDGYEADKVYLQIIRQLQEYFSPTARF
ncbi:MAG: hypothetical protein JNJ57_14080, partial [Saprospiraceae bacterium]|nr:hypothetical protein [Saprospiraceae bacterium]